MSKHDVIIIDYGMGNLLSVKRGLEHCGASVMISSDPDVILSSSRVILPGVGSFSDAMFELSRLGLDQVLKKIADRKIPLMGICLGMQLLFDEGDEFTLTKGLGLIPGRVTAIPNITVTGKLQKIPHIGWNSLLSMDEQKNWEDSILKDLKLGDAVYFVHSFMATPNDRDHRIADCDYGGHKITSVVRNNNIIGCQFHPEKSGEVGLKILRNFCAY